MELRAFCWQAFMRTNSERQDRIPTMRTAMLFSGQCSHLILSSCIPIQLMEKQCNVTSGPKPSQPYEANRVNCIQSQNPPLPAKHHHPVMRACARPMQALCSNRHCKTTLNERLIEKPGLLLARHGFLY